MIGLGADDEKRYVDGRKIDAPAPGGEFAQRQRVIQVELPQILRMHAARHACAVGIPGHQIVRCFALAAQVLVDGRCPQQITGAQHGECGTHLLALEHAGAVHDLFQHIDLTGADEQRQLTGLAEILLCREQRHARNALIALGPENRRRNRQQRAADTVAHRVNFSVRHDLCNRVGRRSNPES